MHTGTRVNKKSETRTDMVNLLYGNNIGISVNSRRHIHPVW